MRKDIPRVLERIGFTKNEVAVYLTLLDRPSNTAGKIARIAKIDRSSCYNALRRMQEDGFVSYVLIGSVKWFQATGPRRLVDHVKEQEAELREVLPELQERHKQVKQEGQVRLFKGYKGIKSIFLDIIRTNADNYVFGSEGQFSENMPEFSTQFNRMKRERGIKTQLIMRSDRETGGHGTDTEYRTVRKLAKSPVVTNIYGNKIAIIIWTKEPEGIIIENKAAAHAYRSYFSFMWDAAGAGN